MRLLSAARPCVNMVSGKWSIGKGLERTHPTAGWRRGDPRCQGAGKILPRASPSGLQWLRAVFKIKSKAGGVTAAWCLDTTVRMRVRAPPATSLLRAGGPTS